MIRAKCEHSIKSLTSAHFQRRKIKRVGLLRHIYKTKLVLAPLLSRKNSHMIFKDSEHALASFYKTNYSQRCLLLLLFQCICWKLSENSAVMLVHIQLMIWLFC